MPFSCYGKDSLPIYTGLQQHHHSGNEPAGCQGIPLVLCLPRPAGICALQMLSTWWSCSRRIQKGTVRQGIKTHVWYMVPLLNTHSQFALMHISVNPEKRSEDAPQWPLCRVLESRAQSSAGSPCSWNCPHLEKFMGESLNMEKRQDIVQNMPLTGSPPLETFHLKKEKYQLEYKWFQLLIAKCFPSPLCICYRCIIHIWMFPGIWFQRFEPVKFWGQTDSNGTPREPKLLLCLNQEAYQGMLNDFFTAKSQKIWPVFSLLFAA